MRHITEDERMKWNGAQLSKISDDNGQPMFNLTTDFHTELQNYPTLTYFSYDKSATNAPRVEDEDSGRVVWAKHMGT